MLTVVLLCRTPLKAAVPRRNKISSGDECAATVRWSGGTLWRQVVAVQNQQGKTRLEIATVPRTAEPDRRWENLLTVAFMPMERFSGPGGFPRTTGDGSRANTGAVDGKIGNTPYKFMVMQERVTNVGI